VAAPPSPRPAPTGEEREAQLREQRDAGRSRSAAWTAQTSVDDIRHERVDNDDDGLQEAGTPSPS
jgi:hypothetical protein